jgi:hypothetical protein
MCLAAVENLGSSEVLQILVIHDDIYWKLRAIQVVSPDSEGFKDGKEFFVMDIVVQFHRVEGAGVESDWMDFTIP